MEEKLQVDLTLPSGTLPGKLSPSYHRDAYSMESAHRTIKKQYKSWNYTASDLKQTEAKTFGSTKALALFSANFPNANPSQRLQFLTNWSSVGPLHGVVFQNRFLQPQSPLGWQILPANLFQRGSSLQVATGPTKSLLQLSTWPQHPLACIFSSRVDCSWVSVAPWTSMGCGGDSLPH